MDDKEIGRLWAEYYPKSKDNRDAFQLCWVICRLIREKARLVTVFSRAGALQRVLDDCGVPKAEFDEIEKGLIKL